jgi:hypothetical protein
MEARSSGISKEKKINSFYCTKKYSSIISISTILFFILFANLSFAQQIVQFVYTSDSHYGITRAAFQGKTKVDAGVVNAVLVAKINSLPTLTLPADGGINGGKLIGGIDYVINTGDIANREETGIQSASASWLQFKNDYIDGLTLTNNMEQKSMLLLLPGNHDVSNAIGYYKTMVPTKDSSSMVNIYNLMMSSSRPSGNYNYANEKIHYSKDISGIHFMFVNMWPDSAERVWMDNDLKNVSVSTPVIIFTHDQPEVESKHFTNPNGTHNINSTDKYENLLIERFKDGSTTSVPSTIEQKAFVAFIKSHKNIVAYFHGNDNDNEFYTYKGPDSDISLNTFRVDSPMKGNISSSDETKLSFQLISLDTKSMTMTVRECLWNSTPSNPSAPIVFGSSKTFALVVPRNFANKAGYITGDFHQHTTYTDGSNSFATMMYMNYKYGLDWWANSEHGGAFATDASGSLLTAIGFDIKDGKYFDAVTPIPILGDVNSSSGHQNMWRWQSLRDYSFKDVLNARTQYPNNVILQSYELNVPGHEHCSMGLITNQFDAAPNCDPLAEFEYKFDNSDKDLTGGSAFGWVKSTATGHEKAVEAAAWLQQNYSQQSYLVFAHPERKSLYKISDFRDLNNAAPDVAFGFESQPGHQKGSEGKTMRGEYVKTSKTDGLCTYGGTGIYAAKVGGLWDAMLGEGRHWWLFASSDCHAVGNDAEMKTAADFFPGEYQKTYTYVGDRTNAQSIIDGLRSGNNWIVEGDLIDSLDFQINNVTMGNAVKPNNGKAVINILIRDPQKDNCNTYSSYKNPTVDHIDLISGEISGKKTPGSVEYSSPENPSTKVVARFDAVGNVTDSNGLTSIKWTEKAHGVKQMSISMDVTKDMYFRLRGTNQGLNITNETDGNGNPLADTLVTATASSAFSDLWFYSNPIFVGNTITDVSESSSTIPKSFELLQNYPNPFNPTTTIEFKIPVTGKYSLKVYDVLGREVTTLISNELTAGTFKVNFDASKLATGMYIYRLSGNNISLVKKMILIK